MSANMDASQQCQISQSGVCMLPVEMDFQSQCQWQGPPSATQHWEYGAPVAAQVQSVFMMQMPIEVPSTVPCGSFSHFLVAIPSPAGAPFVSPLPQHITTPSSVLQYLPGLSLTSNHAGADIPRVSQLQLNDCSAPTPPGTGFCTPEITPRYAGEILPPVHFEQLLGGISPEAACDKAEFAHSTYALAWPCLFEQERSTDDLSEFDDELDAANDGAAAIPLDSKSYASSEASTAISRSARRRRGRKAAKTNASGSSKVILEAPSPCDLLVTEEQKRQLMQDLQEGGATMRRAVSSIRGSMLRMSMEPFGCRAVQLALDVASMADKEGLVEELRSHVLLAIASPHANFVIQKVIEVLPTNSTNFVAEELATSAAELACHRFGCRVFCRLVEHHLCTSSSEATSNLVDEVLLQAGQLIRHNFARHVLELILEHGSGANKHSIAETIRGNLVDFAKHRSASYVVEKALVLCGPKDTLAIASDLLSDPQHFLMLAMHECGLHVVKAAMKSHAECTLKAKELLLADANRVKSSKYGKRLMDEM